MTDPQHLMLLLWDKRVYDLLEIPLGISVPTLLLISWVLHVIASFGITALPLITAIIVCLYVYALIFEINDFLCYLSVGHDWYVLLLATNFIFYTTLLYLLNSNSLNNFNIIVNKLLCATTNLII